jgi:hypothetical protein
MSQFKSLAIRFTVSVGAALLFAGCGQQAGRPAEFHGSWQRICTHPSMTEAAYREAFACHDAARVATRERAAHAARRGIDAAPRALVAGR